MTTVLAFSRATPHTAPSALLAHDGIVALLHEESRGLECEIIAAVKVYPQVLEIVGMAGILTGETRIMLRFPPKSAV